MEVLNSDIPYAWIFNTESIGEADFQIGKYNYTVSFHDYNHENEWDVEFAQTVRDPETNDLYYQNHDLTKTGNEFLVMANVINICKEWFNQHEATSISMSASIPSRRSLYTKLLKQILPNWNIKRTGNQIIASRP